VVNGLLGADVPTDQPLMEAGLDSIGAHQTVPRLRVTWAEPSAWMWRHPVITVCVCMPAEQMPPTCLRLVTATAKSKCGCSSLIASM